MINDKELRYMRRNVWWVDMTNFQEVCTQLIKKVEDRSQFPYINKTSGLIKQHNTSVW